MGRRTLLLIASVLVAALGTALIWLYVQGAESRALEGNALVPVLALARDAEAGTSMTAPQLLRSERVPVSVAKGAVTSAAQLTSRQLKDQGHANQILLDSMLTTQETSRFPSGGAAAITITDPNRVPADLRPGDYVSVYAYGRSGVLRLVTPAPIRVRSVGSAMQPGAGAVGGGTNAVAVTIVGFDADSKQAEALYEIVAKAEQPVIYDVGVAPK